MCGIAGYTGLKDALPFLISGLERLEYRGYDSAGICVANGERLVTVKAEGKLSCLREKVDVNREKGCCGIGHTRWATHGVPSEANAHPHLSPDGRFAVVHNGIIENYVELRQMLTEKGFSFRSETDTEVIPLLMQALYNGDVMETLFDVASHLMGSYALAVVSSYTPGVIYAARKDSPLLVGRGKGENYIASDIPALLPYTDELYPLEQGEFAAIEKERISFFDSERRQVEKHPFPVDWDVSSAEKEGYPHYMLKEIMEQPEAVSRTVLPRFRKGSVCFDELALGEDFFANLKKIHLVACGSACHAGMVGKYLLEQLAGVDTSVELASEFRYEQPLTGKGDLAVFISQSGETSDTLAALRYAKELGPTTVSIVNVRGSSIARESEYVIYTNAGPEIAVATTKAYSAQLEVLFLLALFIARRKGRLSAEEEGRLIKELCQIPEKMKKLLSDTAQIERISEKLESADHAFFIGRGIDYFSAVEGSLKLKEISYIHSEAYAAGELKHGTISLVENETFILALATQGQTSAKMLSNIKEVKARGAYVLCITHEENREIAEEVDEVIFLPKTEELFYPALAILPMQLLAYFTSCKRGLDVDKPRNLAKSVTVE